jgi:hypothetical protein
MVSMLDLPSVVPAFFPRYSSAIKTQKNDLEHDKHFLNGDVLLLTQTFIRFIVS